MSTPFKNRLVGTIIVAAVVVIFLPDILDGEKKTYQDDFEAIPKTPEFSGEQTRKRFPSDKVIYKPVTETSNEVALDIEDENFSEDGAASTLKSDAKNKSDSTLKVTPAKSDPVIKNTRVDKGSVAKNSVNKPAIDKAKIVKPKTLPERAIVKEAWVIHLGSFKHKSNVEQLLKKLKLNGYVAFTKPIKTKQGTLTKVFIGPELIKSSLDKKLPSLKALTGTQGKVARFYPKK